MQDERKEWSTPKVEELVFTNTEGGASNNSAEGASWHKTAS